MTNLIRLCMAVIATVSLALVCAAMGGKVFGLLAVLNTTTAIILVFGVVAQAAHLLKEEDRAGR